MTGADNTAAHQVEALRALYGAAYSPSAAQLASGLTDIGDGLAAQCEKLRRDPTPEGCEALAANLNGAARAVLRLREALLREANQ